MSSPNALLDRAPERVSNRDGRCRRPAARDGQYVVIGAVKLADARVDCMSLPGAAADDRALLEFLIVPNVGKCRIPPKHPAVMNVHDAAVENRSGSVLAFVESVERDAVFFRHVTAPMGHLIV